MTDNELKMMDALAGVVDYIMETSSEMEEENGMLCHQCKTRGLKITLENGWYEVGLKRAIDMFNEMYGEHKEEFDAFQLATARELDVKDGTLDVSAEA